MKKLKVLDLFSGCGGLSLGFKMAGFEVKGAIDNDKDSIETFKKNFGKGKFLAKDINEIKKNEIENNFKDIDIIIGGPPCQGFSNANRWHKNYNDPIVYYQNILELRGHQKSIYDTRVERLAEVRNRPNPNSILMTLQEYLEYKKQNPDKFVVDIYA